MSREKVQKLVVAPCPLFSMGRCRWKPYMKGFMFESYYFLFQNCTPPNPNMNSNNNPDEKGKSYSGLACLHVDVSFF